MLNCQGKTRDMDETTRHKTKKTRRESAVQGTNDSSIVSKCSMAATGYFQDDYLQYFITKITRRSPLIHRGYYIRARTMDYIMKKFLEIHTGKRQIISLGAGFDSTYFRLKHQNLLEEVTFCEIDFPDVVRRKKETIMSQPPLLELVGEITHTEAMDSLLVEIDSANYKLLGIDLGQPNTLEAVLKLCQIDFDCPTLLFSECVLTYMTRRCSSAVIKWAADTFACGHFVIYEQINPNDAFGIFMQKHFHRIGTPLKSISHFPTLASQKERFLNLGWSHCSAMDMNQFYTNLVPIEERQQIEMLEPFDEHEEFHLKCSHYFVLCANMHTNHNLFSELHFSLNNHAFMPVPMKLGFVSIKFWNPNNQTLRLFGHCSAELDQRHILIIGGFGEQDGKHQRLTNLAVMDTEMMEMVLIQPDDNTRQIEAYRMHATLSKLQSGKLLLIGGRISPVRLCTQVIQIDVNMDSQISCDGMKINEGASMSNSCDDNTISDESNIRTNKPQSSESTRKLGPWLDSSHVKFSVVHQSEDIPGLRWRHTAVVYQQSDGVERVLIYGGRAQSSLIEEEPYVFEPHSNTWTQMCTGGEKPEPRHSHSACVWKDHMVIAGGVNSDFQPLNSVHLLNLEKLQWTQLPTPTLSPRYSHTAHVVRDFLVLVGGVNMTHSPPGVALVHLPSGAVTEFGLDDVKDQDQLKLLMLHKYTSHLLDPDDGKILILGGGGNCFSFGTHLNTTPVHLDIGQAIKYMQELQLENYAAA
ncbi:hypothetical protein CHS0354_007991 [Potamilus streckersoni]|uniref:tRNA wybutosine-synthesizing protein 4 n=1 Tax=Potamilus streckersoni TaxID=2493646 RepID=A0AAE0SBL9_9BIVA|nr:hypothetical protein CHS0354_007991 [Potamilus streckersoni]